MIGYYDYTVLLTYLSLISSGLGIFISFSGNGHPYLAVFCLLFCGLCDAFDGKVARMKKNRTEEAESYGIQIDSLSDLIAFGVLPACIGIALMRTSEPVLKFMGESYSTKNMIVTWVIYGVLVLYILSALIRLAFFNVQEEARKKTEGGVRKFYTGLPVTSASLIFPSFMLLRFLILDLFTFDIAPLYFAFIIFTGLSFLLKFKMKKPGTRGILIMVGVGIVEFILILLAIIK